MTFTNEDYVDKCTEKSFHQIESTQVRVGAWQDGDGCGHNF